MTKSALPAVSYRRFALLAVIFALGLFFRFYTLGLSRVGTDEVYPAYDVARMLDGGIFPIHGQPSSVFIDNSVLMSYLQIIPILLWRSIWSTYSFVTLLNTLAILFVYRAVRGALGERIGLLAAFLFAVNPWVAFFSRLPWVQGLVPFLTAVIAWGLWPALVRDKASPRLIVVAGIALTAITQMYVQALGMLGQVVPIVVLFFRHLSHKALAISCAIFLTATVFYGLALAQNWDANQAKLASFAASDSVTFTFSGLNHAVRLVTGWDSEYIRAWQELDPLDPRHIASQITHYLLSVVLLLGVVRAVLHIVRRSNYRRIAAALLIWFVVPILLSSFSSFPVHPHYLQLTLPAGQALAAWGIAFLLGPETPTSVLQSETVAPQTNRGVDRRVPYGVLTGWVVLVLLALIGGLFGLNIHFTGRYVATQPMDTSAVGWPLKNDARLGETIRDLSAGQSYPRRIYANTNAVMLSGISITYVDTYPELDFPRWVLLPGREPMVYMLANSTPVEGALGPKQESFPELSFDVATAVHLDFLRVQPYSRDEALALPEVRLDWPSEAGLTLLGYTLVDAKKPGEMLKVTTYWRIDTLVSGREGWTIGAFYHLLHPDDRQAANVSGHSQLGYRWQEGDVYLERTEIPVPLDLAPGEYRLAIGLFDPNQIRNFSFVSPGGLMAVAEVPVTIIEIGE